MHPSVMDNIIYLLLLHVNLDVALDHEQLGRFLVGHVDRSVCTACTVFAGCTVPRLVCAHLFWFQEVN